MTEALILNANKDNFNEVVIGNSKTIPVIVEFINPLSMDELMNENIWADLANEFAGQFIYAKVDLAEESELREQYQIDEHKQFLVFQNTEWIRSDGQVNKEKTRDLLKEMGIAHESDLRRDEARHQYMLGEVQTAVNILTEAIKKDPGNPRVVMDMVQILVDLKQVEAAEGLYKRLPEAERLSTYGATLQAQIGFLKKAVASDGPVALEARIAKDENDLAARFDLAVCLMTEHDLEGAMSHLLFSISKDPDFSGGAAKEMLSLLCTMLDNSEPKKAADYRRQLANLLAA